MQPEENIRRLLEAGGVLGDKVRLAVTLYLSIKGKARFKELSNVLGISTGNLDHHLKMLEDTGYIKVEKTWEDMRARVLSLTPTGTYALTDFLSKLREFQQ